MLQTMSEMQEEHNQLVHAQWREQGFRFYRAIWVECAEMLDHFGWKWWKKQDPDIDQVKLELVDIWHFAMSELMIKGEIDERLADLMMQPVDHAVDSEAFRICIEKLALDCLNTESVDVQIFNTPRLLADAIDIVRRVKFNAEAARGRPWIRPDCRLRPTLCPDWYEVRVQYDHEPVHCNRIVHGTSGLGVRRKDCRQPGEGQVSGEPPRGRESRNIG